jgi:hypothetical protein
MKICMPALIYLILALFGIVSMLFSKFNITATLIQLIFIIFWTWILNLICNFGLEWLSWIFVLLPFIIIFILVITGSLNLNNLK